MTSDANLDIRPRSTGELLDDAARLCLGDAPILLALSGVFLVPATVVLLLLFAWPAGASPRLSLALPALAALLLPILSRAKVKAQPCRIPESALWSRSFVQRPDPIGRAEANEAMSPWYKYG